MNWVGEAFMASLFFHHSGREPESSVGEVYMTSR